MRRQSCAMVASTRNTGSLPMSPLPKSLSSPQIATRICRGTPYLASMLESSAACRCSIARPPLMRPGPTRVETYCSKVLVKVPRWRRSKASTPISCCTPPSACAIVACEMPALAASAEMFRTKVLKSPPQRAAKAGVDAMKAVRQMARRSRSHVEILPCGSGRSWHEKIRAEQQFRDRRSRKISRHARPCAGRARA